MAIPTYNPSPGVGFWRQRAVMAIVAFCQGVLQKGGGLYRYTEGSTCLSILYLVLGLVASWGHRPGLSHSFPNTVRVPVSEAGSPFSEHPWFSPGQRIQGCTEKMGKQAS